MLYLVGEGIGIKKGQPWLPFFYLVEILFLHCGCIYESFINELLFH